VIPVRRFQKLWNQDHRNPTSEQSLARHGFEDRVQPAGWSRPDDDSVGGTSFGHADHRLDWAPAYQFGGVLSFRQRMRANKEIFKDAPPRGLSGTESAVEGTAPKASG